MNLDLTPAAAPAPRATRIAAHARTEAMLTIRNGEQLVLNLVIPVAALVAGLTIGGRFGLPPAAVPGSIVALAIWSTAFTSVAIATGFERRYGVLERLAATPLTRGDLLAGKALAVALIVAGQVTLLLAVALAFGWRPVVSVTGVAVSVLAAALAVAAFACLALALAGRLRAEAVLGLANLAYIAAAAGGALVLPVAAHPEPLQPVLRLLPWGALGEALRSAAGPAPVIWPVGVLAVWAVLAALLARKAFRWIS